MEVRKGRRSLEMVWSIESEGIVEGQVKRVLGRRQEMLR